jgi:hypothetical protein
MQSRPAHTNKMKTRSTHANKNYINKGVQARFMAGEYDDVPMGNDIVNLFNRIVEGVTLPAQASTASNTPTPTPTVKKNKTTQYIIYGVGGIAIFGLALYMLKHRK